MKMSGLVAAIWMMTIYDDKMALACNVAFPWHCVLRERDWKKGTEKFNRGAIYDKATYHKTMSYKEDKRAGTAI